MHWNTRQAILQGQEDKKGLHCEEMNAEHLTILIKLGYKMYKKTVGYSEISSQNKADEHM